MVKDTGAKGVVKMNSSVLRIICRVVIVWGLLIIIAGGINLAGGETQFGMALIIGGIIMSLVSFKSLSRLSSKPERK